MRIDNEVKLDYGNVLIRPKRSRLSSRKDVDLSISYNFKNFKPDFPENVRGHISSYKGIPIMAANMDGVGTMEMADALAEQGLFTCLVKTYTAEELINYFTDSRVLNVNVSEYVAMSIGINNEDWIKLKEVVTAIGSNLKYICVDVANGYSERFTDFIGKLRDMYPELVIIAGNVVTADQTQELILNGADIVKVGIGPGSVCTTRIQTGVGFPQLSAVIECADAAHGLGGHIIADGGCSTPGDVAKAFAGGADFVMLGGMFAGHEESGGEIVTEDGNMYKIFYGMSSLAAMDKYSGGVAEYRAVEGKQVKIPYKGAISDTVASILGGVRSTCTYVGAQRLKELSKCTTFVTVNNTHNRIYGD